MLSTEIERLVQIGETKASQIEEWKQKYFQLEQIVYQLQHYEEESKKLAELLEIKRKELEECRGKLSTSERELFEVSRSRTDLENKLALISSELERLTMNLGDRKKTIETQQTKISQLELIISELR